MGATEAAGGRGTHECVDRSLKEAGHDSEFFPCC